MKKGFTKKHLVLCVMVLLLGAAVYLNYYVAANTPPAVDAPTGDTPTTQTTDMLGESQFVGGNAAASESYFDAARRNREDARAEALDIIKETLQDTKFDEATGQEVVATAAAVAAAVEQEDAIESLIKAGGFEDCVVYIEGENCHVAVKAGELDESQTLQILQIVTAQSSVAATNVRIMAVA